MPSVIISQTSSGHAPPSPFNAAPPPPQDALAELQASLRQVTHGFQLSRASTMALMRLQLALRSGDRMQAMEAIDRLDTLDAELEGIVTRLHSTDDDDADWQALGKHIESQRLALAFEKLALASGIVGPGLVSIEHAWSDPSEPEPAPAPPAEAGDTDAEAPREMPDLTELWSLLDQFEPEQPTGLSPRAWGLIATLLLMVTLVGATLLLR